MIDKINKERKGHIITVEDPIEFIHRHQSCIVNQREVGTDTKSFADRAQVRAARGPRRHPGRRDARPGDDRRRRSRSPRPVTSRSPRCTPTRRRRRSTASSTSSRRNQQSQVRAQLAFVLEGVVTQTLLPKAQGPRPRDGGRDPGGHAGDPRADPRRQDPPDLLGDAVRQEVRHADDERRAVPALHEPRGDAQEECLRVSHDPERVPPDDRAVARGRRDEDAERRWREARRRAGSGRTVTQH